MYFELILGTMGWEVEPDLTSTEIKEKLKISMSMNVYQMHGWCHWRSEETYDRIRSPGTGVTSGSELSCVLGTELGLLEEQPVFFTAQPSLQPHPWGIYLFPFVSAVFGECTQDPFVTDKCVIADLCLQLKAFSIAATILPGKVSVPHR